LTALSNQEQVKIVLGLLSVYRGKELVDSGETRRLAFSQIGVSSLALASLVVELEDRLDREFDFRAFAGKDTVGGLLEAIGLG
jgi:acyl carrier protein